MLETRGCAEFGEAAALGHYVTRDPHPDGLLPRVLQPARYLLGRGQDERITAWGRRLDSPEHRVGDVHELAQLGEVLAHQREVVPVIEVPDRPDPRDAVFAAELAPERVAGVRRISDHAACTHDIGDLDDRPPLRVGRMDVEVPGHVTSLGLSPTVRRPIPRTVRAGAADACRQVNRPGFQLTIDAILAAVQDAELRIRRHRQASPPGRVRRAQRHPAHDGPVPARRPRPRQ